MREVDVLTDDGRVLHAYDVGPTGHDELVVLWHHGTPNIGAPPEPLFKPARDLGIRWIGYDRPGYGGSTTHRDATVASAAADARQVADELGTERSRALGHPRWTRPTAELRLEPGAGHISVLDSAPDALA